MRHNDAYRDDSRFSDHDRFRDDRFRHTGPMRTDQPSRSDEPEAIEQHIRHTRSAMDETLDEISRRLEPGRLVGEIWHAIRGSAPSGSGAAHAAKDAGASLAHRVAAHPLPSALIGAGLVWLITEEARGRSAHPGEVARSAAGVGRSAAHSATHAAGSAAHAVAHRARDVGEAAVDRISTMGDRAGRSVADIGDLAARSATQTLRSAGQGASRAYENYPLGIGVAALGLGLIAGLAAPNTRRENELFGKTAERFRRHAADTAHEQVDRAVEGADRKVASAIESVERSGEERESSL